MDNVLLNKEYRRYVGPVEFYDIVSGLQFIILFLLGLREEHFLLDIGCGSLRGGKLLIPYLLPNRYYGIEPNEWLIKEGINNEIGNDMINIKKPSFSKVSDFTLSVFNLKFDFILAQSIFSHAAPTQIRKCLSEAKKVMKPTSLFVATFMEGNDDYKGNKWVYPGCVTYTLNTIYKMCGEYGLNCKKIDYPHPNGQTWIVIHFPENESSILSILYKDKLKEIFNMKALEDSLHTCKERLSRLESHPYVKVGLKIRRFFLKFKQHFDKIYNKK
ncbi:class I SAM-dependent methyltransferase [Thermodesulfovibrio sp. 3462-1]|uniref:Class I SAM-dependent methyltransferase n=1 Tax=Thermodesulfovibrio obliviosus TaxID=3118332 RepID=A0AAU8H2Z0_9BACT